MPLNFAAFYSAGGLLVGIFISFKAKYAKIYLRSFQMP